MSKYRLRLTNGRVIGPFNEGQLQELKIKGHISGKEEAQIYPTGDWAPIQSFSFYQNLKDKIESGNQIDNEDGTFVIDLSKIKNKKIERELETIDKTHHSEVQELTETVLWDDVKSEQSQFELKIENKPAPAPSQEIEIELDVESKEDEEEKTKINPVAQADIERLKKEKTEQDKKLAEEREKKKQEEEDKKRALELLVVHPTDESTQMIKLDQLKNDLLVIAEKEEKEIELEVKKIAAQKKKIEKETKEQDSDEEDESELDDKKKKKKIIIVAMALIAIYVILFPSDDKPKQAPFRHLPPQLAFPIPFDKADNKKSNFEFEKAKELFKRGTHPDLAKASILLKSSYENNIDNELALSMLLRVYGEELATSQDPNKDALTIFNLVQSKRPIVMKYPDGVIGLNMFYMAIKKYEAANDVISRYLKLYPKNITQDLFAIYLKTLLETGRLDQAKQFYRALKNAPDKNRYTFDALIHYHIMNEEIDVAFDHAKEAVKLFPDLAKFDLLMANILIRKRKFDEAEKYLQLVAKKNMENNIFYLAKFYHYSGLIAAYRNRPAEATKFFNKSLKIKDSDELRIALASLEGNSESQNETDQLIAESKAIKQLIVAKDFYEKGRFELAMSAAAKATDAYSGHIPSELFLAKVQLRLGLAKQAIKTIESLAEKYPNDKNIIFSLIEAYIDTYKFNDAKTKIGIITGSELKNTAQYASLNAKLFIKMGDSLMAINWLKLSMNLNPLNDRDIYLLADILIKRASFDSARLLLNKCMELDPVNPDYRISYAKIVYEQEDDVAAVGYLLSLLDQFGENPKILAEIAIFYYRAGKIKDFQDFKAKIEALPNKDKTLYEFLIRAALLDERYDDIPALVEKLIDIEPGSIESMMTAGRVLFENAKLVEAAKWFKRVQEKMESYPKVQYYVAKIKFLSKDFDGALKEVESDLKANGDNDADLTLMGQIMVEKGNLVEASALFKKAQKINPKSYEALMGLADISTRQNNYDLALDLYKRALKEKGDEPIINKKMGDVYRLLGQGTLAVESYKLYLELNPEAPEKAQLESYINLMQ
jgi:predicted Zn-dependent protease